jgi:hypothetical protein
MDRKEKWTKEEMQLPDLVSSNVSAIVEKAHSTESDTDSKVL